MVRAGSSAGFLLARILVTRQQNLLPSSHMNVGKPEILLALG